MVFKFYPGFDLRLFDGGAPAAASSDGSGSSASQAGAGETQQMRPDAGGSSNTNNADTDLKALRKEYRELMQGRFKGLYAEDTQRIIDRRFSKAKQAEQQLAASQPVIDMLMQRYGIEGGDLAKLTAAVESDHALWAQAAEEAGMTVEMFTRYQQLQRENQAFQAERQRSEEEQFLQQQFRQWDEEAVRLKETYPDFDLQAEAENPKFLSLLKAGTPMQHAYEVLHLDAIKGEVAKSAEKRVADAVRANGARPQENGTSATGASATVRNASALTKEQRAEIVRKVKLGESVTL